MPPGDDFPHVSSHHQYLVLQGVKWLSRRPLLRRIRVSSAWRHACAAAAALNIAGLMAANLAGFVVGPQGFVPLLKDILSRPVFAAMTLLVFFAAAHLMFGLRDWEAASGRSWRKH